MNFYLTIRSTATLWSHVKFKGHKPTFAEFTLIPKYSFKSFTQNRTIPRLQGETKPFNYRMKTPHQRIDPDVRLI
jgi:hypothetical protein